MDQAQRDILLSVTAATVHTVLLNHGIRRTWMRGCRPLCNADRRIVGPAFTLRYVPAREDLATPASWGSPISTRAAIEAMPEGCICVADAIGNTGAGIFGDILVERLVQRGVCGLVTDGAMRDGAGVRDTGLPVWASGLAAPASITELTFVAWQEPVGCGGVAVFPHDVIVADDDGAVVIPASMVATVCEIAPQQELYEAWAHEQVKKGAALPGLYPPSEETLKRYKQETGG